MKKIFKMKRTFIEPAKRFLSSAASSKLQIKEHQAIGSPVHRVNLPDFKAPATCHCPAMDIGPSMRSKSAKCRFKSKCGKKPTGEMRDLVSSVVDEVLFFKPTPAANTALNKNFKQISNSDIVVLDCRETVKQGVEVLTPTPLSHPQDQKQVSATMNPWETVVESFALVAVEAITLVIESRKKSGKRLSKEIKSPKNPNNTLSGIKGNKGINKLKFGYNNFIDNAPMTAEKRSKLIMALENVIKIIKDEEESKPLPKEPVKVSKSKSASAQTKDINRLLSLCTGKVSQPPGSNSCLVNLKTRAPLNSFRDVKDVVTKVFGIKPFEFAGVVKNPLKRTFSFLMSSGALKKYNSCKLHQEAGEITPWSMDDLNHDHQKLVALSICAGILGLPPKNKALKRDAEILQGILTGTESGDVLDFVSGHIVPEGGLHPPSL